MPFLVVQGHDRRVPAGNFFFCHWGCDRRLHTCSRVESDDDDDDDDDEDEDEDDDDDEEEEEVEEEEE